MNIFLGINGHANNSSLPLRLGIRITQTHQQYSKLESSSYDESGTRGQRQQEIEDGKKHYVGILVIPNEDKNISNPYRLECRVVLAEPRSVRESPPVVTVLKTDNNTGDLTVTRHLEGMLKRGKINPDDLIKIFHPAYIKGDIKSSNDCEEIFEKNIRNSTDIISSNDTTVAALIRNPEPVIKAIEEVSNDDADLKAPPKFKKMNLTGVKYDYVMADAYISDVRLENDSIKLNCINSQGVEQLLHSFKLSPRPHLSALHKYAFDYLKERENQRAVFAICTSENCRGYIAESVTAIALQLMRAGGKRPNQPF